MPHFKAGSSQASFSHKYVCLAPTLFSSSSCLTAHKLGISWEIFSTPWNMRFPSMMIAWWSDSWNADALLDRERTLWFVRVHSLLPPILGPCPLYMSFTHGSYSACLSLHFWCRQEQPITSHCISLFSFARFLTFQKLSDLTLCNITDYLKSNSYLHSNPLLILWKLSCKIFPNNNRNTHRRADPCSCAQVGRAEPEVASGHANGSPVFPFGLCSSFQIQLWESTQKSTTEFLLVFKG